VTDASLLAGVALSVDDASLLVTDSDDRELEENEDVALFVADDWVLEASLPVTVTDSDAEESPLEEVALSVDDD
jgi:hypothetical protein